MSDRRLVCQWHVYVRREHSSLRRRLREQQLCRPLRGGLLTVPSTHRWQREVRWHGLSANVPHGAKSVFGSMHRRERGLQRPVLLGFTQLRWGLQRRHGRHRVRYELHDLSRARELHRVVFLGDVHVYLQSQLQEVQQHLHSVGRLLRVDRVSERHGLHLGQVRVPFEHQGVQRRLHRDDRVLRELRVPSERDVLIGARLHLQQPIQSVRG